MEWEPPTPLERPTPPEAERSPEKSKKKSKAAEFLGGVLERRAEAPVEAPKANPLEKFWHELFDRKEAEQPAGDTLLATEPSAEQVEHHSLRDRLEAAAHRLRETFASHDLVVAEPERMTSELPRAERTEATATEEPPRAEEHEAEPEPEPETPPRAESAGGGGEEPPEDPPEHGPEPEPEEPEREPDPGPARTRAHFTEREPTTAATPTAERIIVRERRRRRDFVVGVAAGAIGAGLWERGKRKSMERRLNRKLTTQQRDIAAVSLREQAIARANQMLERQVEDIAVKQRQAARADRVAPPRPERIVPVERRQAAERVAALTAAAGAAAVYKERPELLRPVPATRVERPPVMSAPRVFERANETVLLREAPAESAQAPVAPEVQPVIRSAEQLSSPLEANPEAKRADNVASEAETWGGGGQPTPAPAADHRVRAVLESLAQEQRPSDSSRPPKTLPQRQIQNSYLFILLAVVSVIGLLVFVLPKLLE